MSNYNLTIYFVDEKEDELIFLDIEQEEVVGLIDLHLKDTAACVVERVREVSNENK